MLNTRVYIDTLSGLQSLTPALQAKSDDHQAALDTIVNTLFAAENGVKDLLAVPDAGPRTDLDFTQLDQFVAAFKANSKLTQDGVQKVAGIIGINTPR